ncbi:MAG: YHS domain-containing protein, partial [bacterium]
MKKIFVLLLLIFVAGPAIAADYNKICPVLGTPVDPKTAIKYEYKGNTYLLCCSGCPEEFSKNPEKYIAIAKPLSGELKNRVREIKVTAKKYEFLPDPIGVKQGEKIRLRITSVDVDHGIGIKEYNINQKLPKGQEQVIEFTADKTGTFSVKCT